MDLDRCFVVPHSLMRLHLGDLNTTQKADGSVYWHVKILEASPGIFTLQMPKTGNHIPLAQYAVTLIE